MPDSSQPASKPAPDFSKLEGHELISPAPESVLQTVKRNLIPEKDSSRFAYGPGHQVDLGPSPQQQGEQQYKETFGSPFERAHGHLKRLLDEFGKENSGIDAKYLAPFRKTLDLIANDLSEAAETGHTKAGGQITPLTRGLLSTEATALRWAPIVGPSSQRFGESVVNALTPPSLTPQVKKGLSSETLARATQGLGQPQPASPQN